MRGRIRIVMLVVVAALCLAVAALGARNGGSAASPIVIEQIAVQNSPIADRTGMVEVVDAAAAWINSKGGINGHRIVVKHCNDQLNPNQNQLCAQQAVSDGAVAVVGSFSNFPTNTLPTLEQARIPYIAGYFGSPLFYASPVVYAAGNAGTIGTAAAVAKAIHRGHPSSVNQISLDVAAAQVSAALLRKDLEQLNVRVGVNVKVPATAVDYSPYVAQLAGAPVATATLSGPGFLAFATALKQSGQKLRIAAAVGNITNKVVAQAGGANGALENAIVGSAYPAVTNPAWKDYKSAVRKYADRSKVELESNNEQSAWVSMMVFWKVAQTIKGKITAAKLIAALNKTKKLSTGGLTPLLNYTKPFSVPSLARCADRWVWRLKVQNGKIVQIGKDTPSDISGLLINS